MIVPGVALLAAAASAGCERAVPPGYVSSKTEFGEVVTPDRAEAQDAIQAGETAVAAAQKYLGLVLRPLVIGPPVALRRHDRCGFRFAWSFQSADGSPPPPSHVLPHEIGHAAFTRFLVPKSRSNEYGSDAPDWLDEMAALAFEDSEGVMLRRADARRIVAQGGGLIALGRLFAMTHPEWNAARDEQPATPGLVGRSPKSPDTPAYYATVRALFDFLVARTANPRVIRTLVDEFRVGRSPASWIISHLGPLDELDAAVARFVLTDPSFAAPVAGSERSD